MGGARVTVCISHVVRTELLRRCLRSLRRNVGLPYETIIINSGSPLLLEDEKIRVVNDSGLPGLGEKRARFQELVETDYMFLLDNDVLVRRGGVELQVEALDRDPRLGVVSGLIHRGEKIEGRHVADFVFEDGKIIKRFHSPEEILGSGGDLFTADFVPAGFTTFRMSVFEDVGFDPEYPIGYEHWDLFLQLYHTPWRCAVHRRSRFEHIKHLVRVEGYRKIRFNRKRLSRSRRRFVEKWGLVPVNP